MFNPPLGLSGGFDPGMMINPHMMQVVADALICNDNEHRIYLCCRAWQGCNPCPTCKVNSASTALYKGCMPNPAVLFLVLHDFAVVPQPIMQLSSLPLSSLCSITTVGLCCQQCMQAC